MNKAFTEVLEKAEKHRKKILHTTKNVVTEET